MPCAIQVLCIVFSNTAVKTTTENKILALKTVFTLYDTFLDKIKLNPKAEIPPWCTIVWMFIPIVSMKTSCGYSMTAVPANNP